MYLFVFIPLLITSFTCAKELVFVQALWRHGDRAPYQLPYPNDYYTEKFWPRGWSELTYLGMDQLRELGKFFRQRYANFTSDVYSPSEMYLRSSDADRALESAQAFLQGFYPPQNGEFEPVAVHGHTPGEDDLLCNPEKASCPLLEHQIGEQHSKDDTHYNEEYSDLMTFLANATNQPDFSYSNGVYGIYDIVRELDHNLTEQQPSWIYKTWSTHGDRTTLDIVTEMKSNMLVSPYRTQEKAKSRGGYLLNQWISDALLATNTSSTHKKMKLYSSHDNTVLALMAVLGVGDGVMPPYGACLVFEVWKDQHDHVVEMYYHNGTVPVDLQLPGCGQPCLVNSLHVLYKEFVLKTRADFDKICGIPHTSSSTSTTTTNMFLYFVMIFAFLVNGMK